jgi:hypothetical protein
LPGKLCISNRTGGIIHGLLCHYIILYFVGNIISNVVTALSVATGTDDIQVDSIGQVTKLGKDIKKVERGLKRLVSDLRHCSE